MLEQWYLAYYGGSSNVSSLLIYGNPRIFNVICPCITVAAIWVVRKRFCNMGCEHWVEIYLFLPLFRMLLSAKVWLEAPRMLLNWTFSLTLLDLGSLPSSGTSGLVITCGFTLGLTNLRQVVLLLQSSGSLLSPWLFAFYSIILCDCLAAGHHTSFCHFHLIFFSYSFLFFLGIIP